MMHEIIVWIYEHKTSSLKTLLITFSQIWKQIWLRNFALMWKFFFDFNPAGESQIAAKKKLKIMKMQLMNFCSTLKVSRRKILTLKVQKDDFCCIVEKSNIFGWKDICFVEKWKKTWKWNLFVGRAAVPVVTIY